MRRQGARHGFVSNRACWTVLDIPALPSESLKKRPLIQGLQYWMFEATVYAA